jgi:hypothetical protein
MPETMTIGSRRLAAPEVDEAREAVTERQRDQQRSKGGVGGEGEEKIGDERADHEDFAVGEVDEPDDPVDHRVAECDEGVEATEFHRVDQRAGEETGVEAVADRAEVGDAERDDRDDRRDDEQRQRASPGGGEVHGRLDSCKRKGGCGASGGATERGRG